MSLGEVIRSMRRQLVALGTGAMVHQEAIIAGTLRRELRAIAEAGRGPWSASSAALAGTRFRLALAAMSGGMTARLGEDLDRAARLAVRDTARYLSAGDLLHGVVRRPAPDLQLSGQGRRSIYEQSLGRYAQGLSRTAELSCYRTSLLGRPHHLALGEIAGAVRREAAAKAWEVRRVVETEVSAAYHQAELQVLIAEDVPEDRMLKQLVATFDSRTGHDSVMVHGQVRPVREPFFDSVLGRYYMAPPNRPHDRERMVGRRSSWGPAPATEHVPSDMSQGTPPPRPRTAPRPGTRKAQNLRSGDVLALPGRPRVASVREAGDRITVQTDRGLLLYFAAGAAIGIVAGS